MTERHNTRHKQMTCTSRPRTVYSENVQLFSHLKINHCNLPYEQIKKKNHIIISIHGPHKHLKNSIIIHDKNSQKNRNRREFPQSDKRHLWKTYSLHHT